jgi:hypothetical protein
MTADLRPHRVAEGVRVVRSSRAPDPAVAAIPRLNRLAATLAESLPKPSRWKEPPVFFFDPARQAELEAARDSNVPGTDPIASLIAAEMPDLFASVNVRRAARAIPGLRESAARHPSAKPLADLLAIPDDEAVLVLHPQSRRGFRLFIRGVADVAQFHLLLLDAIAGDDLLPAPLPSRFRIACAEANPVIPAGVPMVAESRFQFLKPAALQRDGTLPAGFRGCAHWLWPSQPLASVPRFEGERVILLCEPAFRQTWEVERRFPAMPAEVKLLEALGPFRVAEHLGRLIGQPVPVRFPEQVPKPALSRAA